MDDFYVHIIPSVVSFLATLAFISICYNFAFSIDLIDKPNRKRKTHSGQVPLIGGIAILFGFSLACLLSPRSLVEWRPLFLCLIPLAVIGVVDDHQGASVTKRVLIQLISILVMILHGGIMINNLGNLIGFGNIFIPNGIGLIFTIICSVGVINALNLIDGIDGLCSIISINTFVSIIIIVKINSATASLSLVIYIIAALIAFTIINLGGLKKIVNRVFLGDAGTTIIGFIMCWYLIKFTQGDGRAISPITAVWLIGIPLLDTVVVMINRIRSRKSPFIAGTDHIHHKLINIGFSRIKALCILTSLAVGLSAIAIYAEINQVRDMYMFYGFIFVFIVYYILVNFLDKKISKI